MVNLYKKAFLITIPYMLMLYGGDILRLSGVSRWLLVGYAGLAIVVLTVLYKYANRFELSPQYAERGDLPMDMGLIHLFLCSHLLGNNEFGVWIVGVAFLGAGLLLASIAYWRSFYFRYGVNQKIKRFYVSPLLILPVAYGASWYVSWLLPAPLRAAIVAHAWQDIWVQLLLGSVYIVLAVDAVLVVIRVSEWLCLWLRKSRMAE